MPFHFFVLFEGNLTTGVQGGGCVDCSFVSPDLTTALFLLCIFHDDYVFVLVRHNYLLFNGLVVGVGIEPT